MAFEDELDISNEELAVALANVPTGGFPPEALISKERMLSIFGNELDINAFETLGDLATAGMSLSSSGIDAFEKAGSSISSRMRELVLPQ